jgi:hypothetical protein
MVISCESDVFAARWEFPESLICALSRCSSRWHDVHLVLPMSDFYRLWADKGLPVLRRLTMKALHYSSNPNVTLPALELFKTAPVLEDVHLGDGFTLDNVTLPMVQLKYFDSPLAEVQHYLRLVRRALYLIEIGLDLRNLADRSDMPISPIHSSMKTLNIRSHQVWENNFIDVLDCLKCPSLETLDISGYGYSSIPAEPLLRFLSRSSPPLHEFVVNFPHAEPDSLLQATKCLIAMPTLVRLDIKTLTVQTANDLLGRMGETTTLFLPKLQELRVVVNPKSDSPPFSYDTLARVLNTRWNPQNDNVDQLQVFALSSFGRSRLAGTLDPSVALQISALAEEGMDIDMDMGQNFEDSMEFI